MSELCATILSIVKQFWAL